MDSDGKFVDFGFKAEERYAMCDEKTEDGDAMSLFRHFKMALHNKKVTLSNISFESERCILYELTGFVDD